MDCHNCHLTTLTGRREFLKAASLLAGSTACCALATPRCQAAADETTKPGVDPADALTIRGHHLFDMLAALGTGKSSHKTLGPVAQKIRANPKIPIKVVVGVDDICGPCQWWDHQK